MTDFSTLQAQLLASQQPRAELPPIPDLEPIPCPTRTSRIVFRAVLVVVILAASVGFCAATKAAEAPPERVWLLWNESANAAWVSPKGNQSRSTTATACALATVDAARFSPTGTRLACRRVEAPR